MLLNYSVKNFKTFKDESVLNLIASNYDKKTLEEDNVIKEDKFNYRILKSAVMYGANASGKSKLIDSLAFMKDFVLNSSSTQVGDEIEVEPFLLSSESENKPSEFEIIFLHNGELFRYGFEVTKKKVISEWLYNKSKKKEIELFYREGNKYEIHEREFSKGLEIFKKGLVRENALFLSVAAQFNESKAISVIEWFRDELMIISGLREFLYQRYTVSKTKDDEFKNKILQFLKAADLGIQDFHIQEADLEKEIKINEKLEKIFLKKVEVNTMHRKYNSNYEIVENVSFSLDNEESSGTRKFFALSGPIIDVIENGYTLVVDELDSKLHPNLVTKIVSLFNSKKFNPKNAQIIFNTHNTNLLSEDLFRRDQIWFIEKNIYGEAKLYSLDDFKNIRKNDSFEDKYLRGKYGAVPYLGFFDSLDFNSSKNEKQKIRRD
jgi:AAA15 family ATPase/GTPase